MCIHSDDEIAPVAYLQLTQLSLVEKTEMVALNQPVLNHSTSYVKKLTSRSPLKLVEGSYMCRIKMKTNRNFFTEKTSVFHSGPFTWISVSKYEGATPAAVAESVLLTIKGHTLNHTYFQYFHKIV